jgi:hypothetical protein
MATVDARRISSVALHMGYPGARKCQAMEGRYIFEECADVKTAIQAAGTLGQFLVPEALQEAQHCLCRVKRQEKSDDDDATTVVACDVLGKLRVSGRAGLTVAAVNP